MHVLKNIPAKAGSGTAILKKKKNVQKDTENEDRTKVKFLAFLRRERMNRLKEKVNMATKSKDVE